MKYMYEVTDIEWDADEGFEEGESSLPTEIRFWSDRKLDLDGISDRISDEVGFCHKGFKYTETLLKVCSNCKSYKDGNCTKMKQHVGEYDMATCFKPGKEVA